MYAGGADEGAAHGHEDGGGDALATHVGNNHADAVLVDAEEVVEVAAHVLCRCHRCGYVYLVGLLGEGREHAGQDGLLYLAGNGEVALQRLQLRVFALHLVYVSYLLNGFLDGDAQVVEVDGLGGEVEGSVVHGLTDVAHVTVGAHHDDL